MAERIIGMSRGELLGRTNGRSSPATLGTPVEANYRRAPRSGRQVAEFEHYYEPWREWFAIKAVPARDGGIVLYFRDVTEARRADEMRQRLAAIVESSDDIIVSKALDGVITSWNRGAERILGYTAEEVVGKHVSMLMPPENRSRTPSGSSAGSAAARRSSTTRRGGVTKDGTVIDVSLTVSPIRDAEGRIIGASKIGRDITQQKLIEAERTRGRPPEGRVPRDARPRAEEPAGRHRQRRAARRPGAGVQEHIEWAMDVITRQMKHLTRLIDDLLDVSRITRGKIELRRDVLDLTPILDSAAATARPLIEERKHTLELDDRPREPLGRRATRPGSSRSW